MVYKSGQILLPFCHNSRVCRTDGQTDGRTDGRTDGQTDRILIARPRLHYMLRGKNRSRDLGQDFFVLNFRIHVKSIFTALRRMQTRSSDENSVHPSVSLSGTVNCDQTVEDLSRFLEHTKEHLA